MSEVLRRRKRSTLLPPNTLIRYRIIGPKTVMHDVLKARGWQEADGDWDWHFLWADPSWAKEYMDPEGGGLDSAHMEMSSSSSSYPLGGANASSHQSVVLAEDGVRPTQIFRHINHFYGSDELIRYDLAIKHYKRIRKVLFEAELEEEYAKMNFFLPTFAVPLDWSSFDKAFKNPDKLKVAKFVTTAGDKEESVPIVPTTSNTLHSNVWILKPPPKTPGKGSFLFSKMSQISEWRRDYKFKEAQRELVASSAQDSGHASGVSPQSGEKLDPPPHIVQRYVDSPHLIGGKKYDLTVFVLVTDMSSGPQHVFGNGSSVLQRKSDSPISAGFVDNDSTPILSTSEMDAATSPQGLTIWVHRSGFARFCIRRFTMSTSDLEDTACHFSNAAPQKTNPRYTSQTGCKWGLRSLRQYLTASLGELATNGLFADIQASIIRAIQSVHRSIPTSGVMNRSRSELFSFSFVIQHLYIPSRHEHILRPFIINIDNSQNYAADTLGEYHLKYNLLRDYLDVIDLEDVRDHDMIRVGGFDMVWRNGPIGITMNDSAATVFHSFLGCSNELEFPIARINLPQKTWAGDGERSLT